MTFTYCIFLYAIFCFYGHTVHKLFFTICSIIRGTFDLYRTKVEENLKLVKIIRTDN